MTVVIMSCVLVVTCIGFLSVPAAVLGGVALSKADRDPAGARTLTRWAWIAMGAGLWLTIGFVLAYHF